jgi:hypothetical protein
MKPPSATEGRRCAQCDAPVIAVEGAPARRKLGSGGLRRFPAWCRLRPCGHTFMIPGGGLIR